MRWVFREPRPTRRGPRTCRAVGLAKAEARQRSTVLPAESRITDTIGTRRRPNSPNYGVVSFGTPVLIDGGGVRPHFVFAVDRRLTLREPPPVIWFAVIHGLV